MKTRRAQVSTLAGLLTATLATMALAEPPKMKMTTEIPASIRTPDKMKTSIGTLEYLDGVPTRSTVGAVYDYVDRAQAVQVFINMAPAVSMYHMRKGQRDIGATESNQILIWEQLADSKSLVVNKQQADASRWRAKIRRRVGEL